MKEKKNLLIVLLVFFLLLTTLALLNTDGYGGADSFQHYLISRYSWKHPHLFLDHWGKPFFTLLSSTFSQLGYKGLFLFNVIVTVLSGLIVGKISLKLNSENTHLSALFFLAMPMVVLVAISGLTEPLFAFVLVSSVWLFSEKKYLFSLLLLSFLPLVRTEGFVVFPVFAFALMLSGKWKYIPLFLFGGLVYSLIGYFALGDFFWLINHSPYKMETGIYGSGPWYHFLINSRYIFGLPLAILILIGLWFYVPKNLNWFSDDKSIIKILVAGSFAAYFISHSYVWWKGTGGSLGLERVIAGVCPLAAIIALSGYNYVFRFFQNSVVSPLWFQIPFFLFVFKSSFSVTHENLKQGVEQKTMAKAADWIKTNPSLSHKKFYYYNPHIAFLLDKDVFEKNEVEQLWRVIDENEPLLWLEDGMFLVWDAHFGSNEGQTQLEELLFKKDVKILKRFYPEYHTIVLGGYEYQVIIFEKQTGWKDSLVQFIPDSNSPLAQINSENFSVSNTEDYVNVFEEDFSAFSNSAIVYLDVEIKYAAEKKLNTDELIFVLDMSCNGHTLKYDATDMAFAQQENNELVFSKRYMLPPLTKECAIVKAYFWNRAKTSLHGIKIDVKLQHVQ